MSTPATPMPAATQVESLEPQAKRELTPEDVLERGPMKPSPAPARRARTRARAASVSPLGLNSDAMAAPPAATAIPGPENSGGTADSGRVPPAPPLPPPPPPPLGRLGRSRSLGGALNPNAGGVARVPSLVRMYQGIVRREAGLGGCEAGKGAMRRPISSRRNPNGEGDNPNGDAAHCRLLDELGSRSAHKRAVDADVRTQAAFVAGIAREVVAARFEDNPNDGSDGAMDEVVAFVGWLDANLALLLDENAVLRACAEWPAARCDALRDASAAFDKFRTAATAAEEAARVAQESQRELEAAMQQGGGAAVRTAEGLAAASDALHAARRGAEAPAKAAQARLWELTQVRAECRAPKIGPDHT